MIKFRYSLFAGSDEFPIHLQYGFHDKSLYMHSHEDFSELVIVLDGSAEHIVNDRSYTISKGDVFVISSDTEHGFFQPDKMKICNIMFRADEVFSRAYDIKQLAGFQALFVLEPNYSRNRAFCSKLKLNENTFSEIENIIKETIEEYNEKQAGWKDFVFSGFTKLCISLSRLYGSYADDESDNLLRLADVMLYIENNYCDNITMSKLSQISGYSDRQLLRIFKSTFLTTPNLYISELRIKKAKLILGSTNQSIGETAYQCGFDDQNYFSRFFRKVTGMTPSEYRNAMQQT